MSFIYKLKMWIARFMEGRHGPDQFGIFTLIAGLVLSILSGFFSLPLLGLFGTGLYIYTLFRLFSRNRSKRIAENQKYLSLSSEAKTKRDEIKKQKEDVVLSIIYNPIITSDIAEEEFANRMYKLYHSTIADFDANIRKRIKNRISSLNESCEQTCIIIQKIMYAEYLYKRGNIPQNILNDLAKTMMEADYDEDHMEELLNSQGLEVFTGRLEQIMLDQSILSEGFMPVSIVNDKTTDRIKEIITNYQ